MFGTLILLLLVFVQAGVASPCCHLGFSSSHHCRDLSPDLCHKVGGVRLPGSECSYDTCGKTCGNGRREPWEDCDGEFWCDDKCQAHNGTCCSYGSDFGCTHGVKSACKSTLANVRYFVPSNSCEDCPVSIPKQDVCLSGQPCCECSDEWFLSAIIGLLAGSAIGICCCAGGSVLFSFFRTRQKKTN